MSEKAGEPFPNDPPPSYQENTSTCAICLTPGIKPIQLECCFRENSSMVYCEECLLTLASLQPNSTVNKSMYFNCPSCSLVLQVSTSQTENNETTRIAEISSAIGRCQRCSPTAGLSHRRHKLAKTNGQVYDDGVLKGLCTECHSADLLGRLVYECNKCHGKQVISYPMFKSQKTPNDFSSSSWACHQGCILGSFIIQAYHPEDSGQLESRCLGDKEQEKTKTFFLF